jgi:protein-tyrosine phosphatase
VPFQRAPHPALLRSYQAAFYTFLAARRFYWTTLREHGWRTWVTTEIMVGGFLLPSDVAELKRIGVGAVVNATTELLEPVETLRAAGIEYLQVPCWDMRCPSLEDAERGVEFIAAKVAEGKRVYVHCASGVGRSVALVVCYLVAYQGMTVDEALAAIVAKRPRVALRAEQREFVHAFVARWAALRAATGAAPTE